MHPLSRRPISPAASAARLLLALALAALVAAVPAPVSAQTSALGGFRDNGTAGGRAARSENPARLLDRDRARQLGTLDSTTERLERERADRARELAVPCPPGTTKPSCLQGQGTTPPAKPK
ncbi:hypothetical protein GWI72_02170 [Microvirga tunisiensis]|uniref:Uncharacterized protein n=1 Tax=Pannonibacter tanglangensis TaxID=2750084 RepID=A0A7X5EZR2_9HYPH|nr:hypothetical protein [Pannonibacter sp. XCT-53]NBN77068.1 hypothetical protein [Pannonibacter sp. XCT-53]